MWQYFVITADTSFRLSGNNIAHINQTGLFAGMNRTHLDMSRNRIRYIDKSVFWKQGQLKTIILSGNLLRSLGSDIFTDCTNLRRFDLSGNNVSETSTWPLRGLEQLDIWISRITTLRNWTHLYLSLFQSVQKGRSTRCPSWSTSPYNILCTVNIRHASNKM